MHGMRDALNSHRDYRIEGKIWFGMTGLKNTIRQAKAKVARGSPSIRRGSQVGLSGHGICLI